MQGAPKAATTLQQVCQAALPGRRQTVTGTLSGAPAGSTVDVTFKSPIGTTTVVHATTDAKGNWEASVTPGSNDLEADGKSPRTMRGRLRRSERRSL